MSIPSHSYHLLYIKSSFSWFESHRIWASALVVSEHCDFPSHWRSTKTLSQWMKEENVPGICGIDTRELTKRIREKGTILGRIVYELPIMEEVMNFLDPNDRNLVQEVSIKVRVRRPKYGITTLGKLVSEKLCF